MLKAMKHTYVGRIGMVLLALSAVVPALSAAAHVVPALSAVVPALPVAAHVVLATPALALGAGALGRDADDLGLVARGIRSASAFSRGTREYVR